MPFAKTACGFQEATTSNLTCTIHTYTRSPSSNLSKVLFHSQMPWVSTSVRQWVNVPTNITNPRKRILLHASRGQIGRFSDTRVTDHLRVIDPVQASSALSSKWICGDQNVSSLVQSVHVFRGHGAMDAQI